MTVALPALVSGLSIGALYGLFALSIVVLYRTTNLVNFAQGNMAMFMGFIALFVLHPLNLPLWMTFLLALLAGAAFGGLIYVVVMRPRPSQDHYNELFRTLGLSLLLFAVAKSTWGDREPYAFPSPVVGSFNLVGFQVQWLQVLTLSVALVLAVGFAAFLRTPRFGLMMRAVALDKEVATLLGVRVRMVELIAWLLVGGIGAAIGLLLAPSQSLSSEMMEPFLLKAFAAALLGGLSSFGGALAAGLLVGIVDAQVLVFAGSEWSDIASFVLILGILLIRPAGIFGRSRVQRV
jgi:branched-chain amino acid transport system permease protein